MTGVVIVEAKISYIAYATEIASAMLMKQQAQATVAARGKIVQGSVGMCEMAMKEIEMKQLATFSDE